jgi:hypothetical protein
MSIALQLSDSASALAFAMLVAAIFLAVLRLVDLNEKEPLWALGLFFALGASSSALLHLVMGSPGLRLHVWSPALAEETARLAAIVAGVAALWAVGQMRGWREIGGVTDGIVYGAAAGLGFAAIRILIDRLVAADTLGPAFLSGLEAIGRTALAELRDGLFGGLIGAGVGAAAVAATTRRGVALSLAGWVAAVLVHAAYLWIARGYVLGDSAQVRAWFGLVLPLGAVVALMIVALVQERKAIDAQLPNDASVRPEDLEMLGSLRVRITRSWQALIRGDLQWWAGQAALQNRLVQLALMKQRSAVERDPARRQALDA